MIRHETLVDREKTPSLQRILTAAAPARATVALGTPVLAQSSSAAETRQPGPPRVTTPGTPDAPVVEPGGLEKGGPGSIGSVAPGATGAETRSNNSGAGGNAEQNQKPIGNTGGGGGS